MIDGITLKYTIKDFPTWKNTVNIEFFTKVEVETGDFKAIDTNFYTVYKYWTEWENLLLSYDEVLNKSTGVKKYYLIIKGSLHKSHHNGTNYRQFPFEQLQDRIKYMCKALCLDPNQVRIANLEIGVNINTPFEVFPFLQKNIINYKGYRFSDYQKDKENACLGIWCDKLSQYKIKIYDKAHQNFLINNLMRFELRYIKMQPVNKLGIKFLSDLQVLQKVERLQDKLLKAWNNLLIYDIKQQNIPISHATFIGQHTKHWETMIENNKKFVYWRMLRTFKNEVAKYGEGYQAQVFNLIKKECYELLKCEKFRSELVREKWRL